LKFIFIHLINFRGDKDSVFQRVSMNLKMTVGQAAYYCVDIFNARWLHPVFADSYRLLRTNQAKEPLVVRASNAPAQSLRL